MLAQAGLAKPRALFFVFLHLNGFEVFGLEDLTAVETFEVVYTVSPGDDLGAVVVTSDLHD